MKSFIDTDNINNEQELIEALKHNCKVSAYMREEIQKMEKINESNIEMTFKEETEIKKEEFIEDTDLEYLYYYEPIKNIDENITDDELKHIIKENLPIKINPNYFKIISRIIAEIFKEIIEYEEIKKDSIGEEEIINETKKLIDLNKKKIEFIKNIEIDLNNSDEIIENELYFLKTGSGNTYCLSDLSKIKKEYYESFKELFESIKNGTFKQAKRLNTSNNKTSSISEVRGFKTRIIFDRIGENSYIILMCAVKKSDFDNGYKKSIENRNLVYKAMKPKIYKVKDTEEYKQENKQFEKKLFLKLEERRG